jgi:replicative DNA helicase
MDDQGSIVPGDVISFVGRPAQGKSWMMLYIALHNWRYLKKNVLFVSMEMNPLSIAQRVTAMYAHVPYGQLKKSGFSSSTYKKFEASMT